MYAATAATDATRSSCTDERALPMPPLRHTLYPYKTMMRQPCRAVACWSKRRLILAVAALLSLVCVDASLRALWGGESRQAASSDENEGAAAARKLWPSHRKLLLAADGASATNKWIIMFREDRGKALRWIASRQLKVQFEFQRVLNAIVVSDLSTEALTWLLDRDEVMYIEQEQRVYLLETNVTQTLKDGQPWGIDLIDGVRDGKFQYSWTGQGVNVYIFDTGIQINHMEFATESGASRASCGFDLFDEDEPDNGGAGGSSTLCKDDKGHGTHIAGTIGGMTYGIAKGVNLVAVRVLDENLDGGVNGVIKGLDYVAEQKTQSPNTPMVVNLSLGTNNTVSVSMNEAVNRLADLGVIVIGASGNVGINACVTSPASAEKCIAVGAIDSDLRRPRWSNFGGCVDVHAPGQDILSSTSDRRDRRKTLSRTGTSMAVPHVAGVVAMYLQWNPKLNYSQIIEFISRDSTQNALTGLVNSSNLLLNSAAIRRRTAFFPTASVPVDGTPRPSVAPILQEPTPTAPAPPKCKGVFGKCRKNSDCCLQTCRQFRGWLNQRCFLF